MRTKILKDAPRAVKMNEIKQRQLDDPFGFTNNDLYFGLEAIPAANSGKKQKSPKLSLV